MHSSPTPVRVSVVHFARPRVYQSRRCLAACTHSKGPDPKVGQLGEQAMWSFRTTVTHTCIGNRMKLCGRSPSWHMEQCVLSTASAFESRPCFVAEPGRPGAGESVCNGRLITQPPGLLECRQYPEAERGSRTLYSVPDLGCASPSSVCVNAEP